jgi:hypothetical protein
MLLKISSSVWISGELNPHYTSDLTQKKLYRCVPLLTLFLRSELYQDFDLRSHLLYPFARITALTFDLYSLLYFASIILANRPFWSVPTCYDECIRASKSIEKLVSLLESAFGLENITYLMGYCIYTGASAILEDANKGSTTAYATLRTFLRALNIGMRRSPLLGRSLNIIVKGMHSASLRTQDETHQVNEGDATQGQANSYIPAFPYMDSMASFDFDVNSYLGGIGMDSITGLDCFPESQIELGRFVS